MLEAPINATRASGLAVLGIFSMLRSSAPDLGASEVAGSEVSAASGSSEPWPAATSLSGADDGALSP